MATKLEGGGEGLSGRATKKDRFFAASLSKQKCASLRSDLASVFLSEGPDPDPCLTGSTTLLVGPKCDSLEVRPG